MGCVLSCIAAVLTVLLLAGWTQLFDALPEGVVVLVMGEGYSMGLAEDSLGRRWGESEHFLEVVGCTAQSVRGKAVEALCVVGTTLSFMTTLSHLLCAVLLIRARNSDQPPRRYSLLALTSLALHAPATMSYAAALIIVASLHTTAFSCTDATNELRRARLTPEDGVRLKDLFEVSDSGSALLLVACVLSAVCFVSSALRCGICGDRALVNDPENFNMAAVPETKCNVACNMGLAGDGHARQQQYLPAGTVLADLKAIKPMSKEEMMVPHPERERQIRKSRASLGKVEAFEDRVEAGGDLYSDMLEETPVQVISPISGAGSGANSTGSGNNSARRGNRRGKATPLFRARSEHASPSAPCVETIPSASDASTIFNDDYDIPSEDNRSHSVATASRSGRETFRRCASANFSAPMSVYSVE